MKDECTNFGIWQKGMRRKEYLGRHAKRGAEKRADARRCQPTDSCRRLVGEAEKRKREPPL